MKTESERINSCIEKDNIKMDLRDIGCDGVDWIDIVT
jgi:hypothetical protein